MGAVTGCCSSVPRLGCRLRGPVVGHVIRLGRHSFESGSRFSCTPISRTSTVSSCSEMLSVINSVATGIVTPGTRNISTRNPRYCSNHISCTDKAIRGLSTVIGTNVGNVAVPHGCGNLGFPVAPCAVYTRVITTTSTNFNGV